ncbi:hypothetical protein QBC37DRAFT_477328 [Rhypophila decipiens]|uniref:Vacuolar sorting protein Vps3844 C-terminal domain-containing protein n=1 Tax=Rhypophila decipiens TaxID=261697 RepID=A0AAN6YLN6_9PEZI|nr:hypothetical protein QBC37DRAFT_477328 [Rhypophila decipiens]
MRFSTGIAVAALSGLTTASADQDARVYHLMSSSRRQQIPQDTPQLPKEVARHILLQRTSTASGYGSDLRDLPESVDTDAAVSYIARYGKRPLPIFSSNEKTGSSQLVVIIEGATQENVGSLVKTIEESDQAVSFVVSNPPSAVANGHLMDLFDSMGAVPSPRKCDLESAINPFDSNCWTTMAAVLRYDLKKSPSTTKTLLDNFSRLTKFVDSGDLEATLVLMPESSRSSKIKHWSALAAGEVADLRRRFNRDAETVMTDLNVPAVATASSVSVFTEPEVPSVFAPEKEKKTKIPQCFSSFNACTKQTDSCSGHGECVDKYSRKAGNASTAAAADAKVCFVCQCNQRDIIKPGKGKGNVGIKTVAWAGNKCQKIDVSVPFWLLAGFTITIMGAITFAIGLLYSIGNEPLPGVIGAGVIRSSK